MRWTNQYIYIYIVARCGKIIITSTVEDVCTIQNRSCAGRLSTVLLHGLLVMQNNNTNTRQDLGDVLYCIEDGVEFWTNKANGQSAISQIGLARLCGVDEKSIRHLISGLKNPRKKSHPECLESWKDKDLAFGTVIKKKGGKITALNALFCADVIFYYAVECDSPKEEAIKILRKYNRMGVDSWVQGKTGYLKEENQQATKQERDEIDAIIQSMPRKWELHFNKLWQREACRLTGYRWRCDIRMARFISQAVYQLLPKDIYDRLMEVNSDRRHKHHQYFTEQADELVLKQHIQCVLGMMLGSNSVHQFWRLMKNAFSDGIQIDLDLDI